MEQPKMVGIGRLLLYAFVMTIVFFWFILSGGNCGLDWFVYK